MRCPKCGRRVAVRHEIDIEFIEENGCPACADPEDEELGEADQSGLDDETDEEFIEELDGDDEEDVDPLDDDYEDYN
ncbi:MAG: hypothetical protein HYY96_05790 [Candidatus Tectomicrobia bacterium]|nr:hypothetical protein [Candidatus Tectomicrobia bacterium]